VALNRRHPLDDGASAGDWSTTSFHWASLGFFSLSVSCTRELLFQLLNFLLPGVFVSVISFLAVLYLPCI